MFRCVWQTTASNGEKIGVVQTAVCWRQLLQALEDTLYGPCHFIIRWFHHANLKPATAGLSVPWKSESITKKKYFILHYTYLDSIIPLQKETGMKREGKEEKNSVVGIYFQISDL